MKTSLQKVSISLDFTTEEYFLVHESRLAPWEWYLGYKCDRSEKGKEPELGATRIFLTDYEVEEFKKYFEVIEI